MRRKGPWGRDGTCTISRRVSASPGSSGLPTGVGRGLTGGGSVRADPQDRVHGKALDSVPVGVGVVGDGRKRRRGRVTTGGVSGTDLGRTFDPKNRGILVPFFNFNNPVGPESLRTSPQVLTVRPSVLLIWGTQIRLLFRSLCQRNRDLLTFVSVHTPPSGSGLAVPTRDLGRGDLSSTQRVTIRVRRSMVVPVRSLFLRRT